VEPGPAARVPVAADRVCRGRLAQAAASVG